MDSERWTPTPRGRSRRRHGEPGGVRLHSPFGPLTPFVGPLAAVWLLSVALIVSRIV